MSHRLKYLFTDDARITADKYSDIVNYISAHKSSTYDLMPMDVHVSPSSVQAGSQLSSMDYLVHNDSTSGWSGTVNVKVFLERTVRRPKATVSSFSGTASHGNSAPSVPWRVNVTLPPTIPVDAAARTYTIGVGIENSDAIFSNNYSWNQEIATVIVSAPPPESSTRSLQSTRQPVVGKRHDFV